MDIKNQTYSFTNRLAGESSPYLLQHANNPVDWYPWGQEALTKAKKENKLLIVSIGYAACHWCHVMAHESFEDAEIAGFMNEKFVSIKVDREERADLDQVYMNAVQLITGRGGWPLNVITMPDGRPLYGGTYFPKDEWLFVLQKVHQFVEENPDKAEEQAKDLTYGVRSSEVIIPVINKAEFKTEDLKRIFRNWKNSLDPINGGYRGAPKFPMPVGLQYLLHYSFLAGEKDAINAVKIALNKMANGGIYDHAGGGFSRYSTDAHWKVPHFEKMLYDNAQLVTLYATTYQATQEPLYKNVVYETLEFVKRELTANDGSFYSSIDADSEGEEGRFYVWSKKEIEQNFPEDSQLIIDYFNITDEGNWENGWNIIYSEGSSAKTAKKYNISEDELQARISPLKKALFKLRSARTRPGTDDKVITGWNALMLKGYVDAYRVFNEQEYLSAALRNASFLMENMKSPDNRLDRTYKNKASVNAFLDDYAFTIEALISLYHVTFEEKWLIIARDLTEYVLQHFYDLQSGMFYYTSDLDPQLIARKMEITDHVVPSSNSTMAKNLFLLGTLFFNDDYLNKSALMATNVREVALQNGVYYANWDILISWLAVPPAEVSIVGEEYTTVLKEFHKHFLTNIIFSGGSNEGMLLPLLRDKLIPGQTTIYVCKERTCNMPVTYANEALIQIEHFNSLMG